MENLQGDKLAGAEQSVYAQDISVTQHKLSALLKVLQEENQGKGFYTKPRTLSAELTISISMLQIS